jgi:TPP-dependent pyruvate/acetoin dehydrogenase alpha subunit
MLAQGGFTEDELAQLLDAIAGEIDAAVVHAKESPWPDPAELTRYVYPEEAVQR